MEDVDDSIVVGIIVGVADVVGSLSDESSMVRSITWSSCAAVGTV